MQWPSNRPQGPSLDRRPPLAAGSSIIAKNSVVRTPFPIAVTLPSGNDGSQCTNPSTGAPASTLFPTAATTPVNTQFVEAPEGDGAFPSGAFYSVPRNGAIALTVVEQGQLKWRWFSNSDAMYACGYLSNMGLVSADLPASVPMGDYITTSVTYVHGPSNLAAASCGPGSTIENIIGARYGYAASGCNSSSSYR